MQIIKKIKQIQEAAKRQGIVVTDILESGTVVSDLPAYRRTYHLKEMDYPRENMDDDYDDYKMDMKKKGKKYMSKDEFMDHQHLLAVKQKGYSPKFMKEMDDEDNASLEMDDEEMKTKYDTKGAAASSIVDSIIKGDFEEAHEALDDYLKLYKTDMEDDDECDDCDDAAEEDGEMSGTGKDYLMPAATDGEDEDGKMNEDNRSRDVMRSRMKDRHKSKRTKDRDTEAAQLAAVKKDGLVIAYIIKNLGHDPSEAVQLAAVKQNGLAIDYIKDPSEEVQLAAVKEDGYAIEYIKSPSEEVQLAAVKQDGYAIEYIINNLGHDPSEAVQLAAVKQDGNAIEYIEDPSEAVKRAARVNR